MKKLLHQCFLHPGGGGVESICRGNSQIHLEEMGLVNFSSVSRKCIKCYIIDEINIH